MKDHEGIDLLVRQAEEILVAHSVSPLELTRLRHADAVARQHRALLGLHLQVKAYEDVNREVNLLYLEIGTDRMTLSQLDDDSVMAAVVTGELINPPGSSSGPPLIGGASSPRAGGAATSSG